MPAWGAKPVLKPAPMFEMNDSGKAIVKDAGKTAACVDEAIDACPAEAISK